MTAEVVEGRSAVREIASPEGLLPLAQREAWRILKSPALLFLLGYVVLTSGLGGIAGEDISRAMVAEFAGVVGIFFGIAVFPAVHLTATSARRTGAEAQLAASPREPLDRDLALCLGVVLGPGLLALLIGLVGKAAAGGGIVDLAEDLEVEPWTLTDVMQLPAMAIGAGILAIVVARWLPFPGSLLIGLFGMMFLTLAVADLGRLAWLAWFHISSVNVDDYLLKPDEYLVWHTAYLFCWSALGVCAVGIRQASRKRGWIVAFGVAAAAVVATGLLQLPPYTVELFG